MMGCPSNPFHQLQFVHLYGSWKFSYYFHNITVFSQMDRVCVVKSVAPKSCVETTERHKAVNQRAGQDTCLMLLLFLFHKHKTSLIRTLNLHIFFFDRIAQHKSWQKCGQYHFPSVPHKSRAYRSLSTTHTHTHTHTRTHAHTRTHTRA